MDGTPNSHNGVWVILRPSRDRSVRNGQILRFRPIRVVAHGNPTVQCADFLSDMTSEAAIERHGGSDEVRL